MEDPTRVTPMEGAIWVDAFKIGDLVAHPKYGDKRYTEPQLREAIGNFRTLKARGYATTLLREHGQADSYVYGEIHDLRIHDDGYFQCLTSFFRKVDRDAYNEGILREFSPAFADVWLDPHTGEKLNNVLIELSFTSRAYQRNLRPPQEINPGVILSSNADATPLHLTPDGANSLKTEEPNMEPETNEPAEPAEEFNAKAAYEAMEEKIEMMSADIAAIKEMVAPAEPEAAAMSDSDSEVERLNARIAELECETRRQALLAAGVTGDDVEDFARMSASMSDSDFAKFSAKLAGAPISQPEIGVTGDAPTLGEPTAADIAKAASKAGYRYGDGGFSIWVMENYPESNIDEVINAAR